jgi:hypothetical protein
MADFRKRFEPFPPPPTEDEMGFKSYLDETLLRFRAGATNAGVQLPPDFGFTFSGLVGKLTYPPGNIGPWMQQLEEIDSILQILYGAKINSLAELGRVPVSVDDTDSGLSALSVTNSWGVVTPYKITFRGFSGDVGRVMEGFARSSHCYIIKDIVVVPDTTVMQQLNTQPFAPQQQYYTPTPAYTPPPQQYGNYPPYGGRPGGPGVPAWMRQNPYRVAPTYAPQVTYAAPAAPQGPVTILSENPLLVTLSVDLVKLNASEH